MKRRIFLLAIVMLYLLSAVGPAAAAESITGIIKGSVTIGGKPTQDAVVSVEGIAPEQIKAQIGSAKSRTAVLDQRNLKFIPYVLPVLVGTKVEFPNHDKTWHNVYSKGGAKEFDVGLYPPGKTRSATFEKPGISRILCNAHPNMEAFIVVMEHPYFSGTDKRGNYRLNRVPLGTYSVKVWHPQLGSTETSVELLREGQVMDVNFDLKKK